jgi:hypothetical protein
MASIIPGHAPSSCSSFAAELRSELVFKEDDEDDEDDDEASSPLSACSMA